MPSDINIPSRREVHCEPCEFHKCTGSLHVRSGEGSWRQFACMHPEAFDDGPPLSDPDKEMLRLRWKKIVARDGRNIGKTEKQPDWCPLNRK